MPAKRKPRKERRSLAQLDREIERIAVCAEQLRAARMAAADAKAKSIEIDGVGLFERGEADLKSYILKVQQAVLAAQMKQS